MKNKIRKAMILLAGISLILSFLIVDLSGAYYDDTSVLTGSIYNVQIAMKATGVVRVFFPKYVVVNKPYTVNVSFERSYCFSSPVLPLLEVLGKVQTNSGEEQFVAGTFSVSFYCKDQSKQRRSFTMLIPEAIYDKSTDKTVTLYIKCSTNCALENQIPARVTLVNGVPEPRIVINLNNGYLYLDKGEAKTLEISVTALNAPLLVDDVKIDEPSFISASAGTPLPLVISPGSETPIMLTIHGIKPGAGILAVRIYYKVGTHTKHVTAFIPVIVEENEITALLKQYEDSIKNYYQQLSELESTLHIKIKSIQESTQALKQIVTELNKITTTYASTINDVKNLKITYNNLAGRLSDIQRTLNNLTSLADVVQGMKNSVNSLNVKQSSMSQTVSQLLERVSELQSKVNKLNTTTQVVTIVLAIVALAALVTILRKIK